MKRPKRLSATFVKTVTRPGRYGEGRGGFGLSLLVKPRSAGGVAKSWSQRLRINGRVCNLGLGTYPVVTLAEARAKALENRRAVAQGLDPRERSRTPTFAEAAETVIQLHEPTWRAGGGADSAKVWRASLRNYVFPRIGSKRVHEITSGDVLRVLTPIWHTKTETARRVKGRISTIMKWAIAQEYRDDDPAGDAVAAALPKKAGRREHHRALPHAEVGAAVRTVRESGASPATKLAFEFLVLTAARSGEVREARWHEVCGAIWTVPAERMKMNREHRVPLSNRAVEVLDEARTLMDASGLLFPSPTGRGPLSNGTVVKLLRELGVKAVPHGFRSSFRDWAAETGHPRELAEQALAHANPNKVEAAYARSDLLDQRAAMMEAWAQYAITPIADPGADAVPNVHLDDRPVPLSLGAAESGRSAEHSAPGRWDIQVQLPPHPGPTMVVPSPDHQGGADD